MGEFLELKRYDEISTIAGNVLDTHSDVVSKNYVDVISLAQKLGFVIAKYPLPENEDGIIIIDDKNNILDTNSNKLILVNKDKSLQWARFIIAHEIGHYKLHYLNNVKDGYYAHRENIKDKSFEEQEADFFAACLLMPRKLFLKQYNQLESKSRNETILTLADEFMVTPKMVERRIEELIVNEI